MASRLALLVLLAPAAALAAPSLDGLYYGEVGVLRFDTQEDGRVAGHYERGGACDFEPDRRVMEGMFEGDLLVGTVTLCQVGPACQERVYPILAFYDARDGELTADLKVETGCRSPALKNGRLVMLKGAPPKGKDPGIAKRRTPKRNAELARRALDLGQRALSSGDYALAKGQFERGLSYDEKNFAGYLGLGVAEFALSHAPQALLAFQRSAELKNDYPDTFFNMACVFARLGDRKSALASLDQAVQLGFSDADIMKGDKDLGRVFANDPEFEGLVGRAGRKKTAHRPGSR